MSKSNFQFEVEITHQDPPARYKDRHFRYIIENKSDFNTDDVVKKFCTSVLRIAVDKDSQARSSFATPYIERFEKIKDRTYEYWVVEPNTD